MGIGEGTPGNKLLSYSVLKVFSSSSVVKGPAPKCCSHWERDVHCQLRALLLSQLAQRPGPEALRTSGLCWAGNAGTACMCVQKSACYVFLALLICWVWRVELAAFSPIHLLGYWPNEDVAHWHPRTEIFSGCPPCFLPFPLNWDGTLWWGEGIVRGW